MAVSPVSKIKLVVVSADGTKVVLTPAEFARMRLQPGMKVAVLDETTGQSPKGLTAKTQGQDLLLELPEHGLLAKVEGFEQIADLSFAEDIQAITTAQNTGVAYAQAAPATPVATDAGGATAEKAPVPASGTVGGFSLSTLGVILGGLALAGGGGGGGGGGGSSAGGGSISSSSGLAIDGYLSGSTVTRANNSGNSVTTDANGRFTGLTGTGPIKVTGGYQLVGGQLLPFEGTLLAPEGSTVVTPITTLIQAAVTPTTTVAQATALIKDKLNLPDSFDVLSVDPIAQVNSSTATPEQKAAALEVFKTGVAVATALQVAADSTAVGDNTAAAFTAAVGNLLTALENSTSTESGVQVVVASLSAVGVAAADLAALQDGLTAIDAIDVAGGTESVGAVQGNTLVQTTDQGAAISATFTVAAQNGAVTFGGTALGAITINVAANGTATFERQGTTATTTVDGLLDSVNYLDIQSPAGAALNFNFAGGTTDDVVAISAPNMGNLVLQGTLGGGQDSVMIKVADIPVSAGQVRQLSVDTSGLTGVEHLAFDFADVADTVVLTNSNFSNIATIEVKKGEADLHQVSIPDGTVFIVNSGLTLTVAQLLATDSISSVTGLGRLTIIADSAGQLDGVAAQIATKIASNPAFLIGFAAAEPGYIEVKVGTAVVASNQTGVTVSSPDADGVALMNALSGGSLPSIPTLAGLVDDLQAQITDLELSGAESIATVATNLATLSATVTTLQGTVATNATAAAANLASARSALEALIEQLALEVEAEIARVDADMAEADLSNTSAINTVASNLATLSATVTTLQGTVAANATTAATNLASARSALEALIEQLALEVEAEIARVVADMAAADLTNTNAINAVAADLVALEGVVTALDVAYRAADATLQGNIDTVQSNLTSAVSSLTTLISAEAARITAEIAARQAGDATNTAAINAVAADLATLEGVVTALDAAYRAADATLQDNIDTVQSNLTAAVSSLTTLINAEAARITAEIAARQAGDATNTAAINAVAADLATLEGVVTALDAAYRAADVTLQDNIDTVQSNLTAAVSSLTTLINAEAARITAEIAARQAGDATNTAAINAVAADLATLEGVVTALDVAYRAADASLQVNINQVQANLNSTYEGLLAMIQTEAARITAEATARQAGDTANAAAIADAVADLATLQGVVTDLNAAYQSADTILQANITAAQNSLSAAIAALTEAAMGQGVIKTVADLEASVGTEVWLANFRLADTLANLLDVAADSEFFTAAKKVTVIDSTIGTAAEVTALQARGVDFAASAYDVTSATASVLVVDMPARLACQPWAFRSDPSRVLSAWA